MVLLQEIVGILTGGIVKMAEGIGTGLQQLVTSLFLKVGDAGAIEGLSTFGIVVCVFGGVALAIGLSRFVLRWVSTFGK